jgi:hypothetical protein
MKNLISYEDFLNESYAYDTKRGCKHIKFILSDPLMYKTPFYISFKKGTTEKEVENLIKEIEKENKSISKMKRTYGPGPFGQLSLQIEKPNYAGLTWIFKALDEFYGNNGDSMGWFGSIGESITESELNEMKFTSAGVKELLSAIYYNWDKLKKELKNQLYFKDFKQILDYMKDADQEEQKELEDFVKSQGIEILALDK